MAKRPPIPKEQRSFHQDRRDRAAEAQSGQPGDANVNVKTQGRHGNVEQNVKATHWKTQDR